MEVLLASMCSLAGVAARGCDPIEAVGELHYSLSDDMALLRSIHQRLRMLSGAPDTRSAEKLHMHPEASIQEQLDQFEKTWTTIVEQLSPGRLANEMAFYAHRMRDLVDEDKRYAFEEDTFEGDEQWVEQMAISGLRRHQLFHPMNVLLMEMVEGHIPV